MPRLEKKTERDFVDECRMRGVECLKLASPGTRGLPDRLLPLQGGVSWFVEFKREGEALSPAQVFWKDVLETLGFEVSVFDTLVEATEALEERIERYGH